MSQPYEESQLYRIRHSAAHVMAQAMLERFPEAHIAIGPPIEDGFYYDFDLPRPIQEEDLAWVEGRMKEIVKGDHPFSVREVEVSEALDLFRDQPYKVELINDLVHGRTDENGKEIAAPASKLTIYTQDTFTDLCRGPHVASTKDINPDALSITFKPPAGAYWRGDEKRPMLTRIYGTAWETPEQLADYLHRLEEAKRRDHRYLGEKLDLFILDPLVGKGLPLWLPKGAILRDTLERWLRQLLLDSGYEPVVTPHIGSIELYKTSGHYPYYKDTQYAPIDVDGELFLLKPMNCPHHIMIYKSELRSFRDLPVRYAEYGTVYRYEKSGQLHGLTRVRGFTQDDAHLFVTPEQLESEYISTVKLAQYVMGTLGMTDFRARVGIRDPKSDKFIGDDALWETATKAIINACEQLGLDYTVEEGEAAFYGPKLDLVFHDVLKREWQLGTVQVDPNLPERFELEYVDSDGQRKRPVMIHRALFGSVERFIGIMIEHFGGAFPTWLAPVQAVLIPIADRHIEYLQGVVAKMRARGLRVEVDTSNNRMGAKIAMAREQQVPYMLIAGDRDVAAEAVSVRLRTDEDRGQMPLEDAIAHIVKVVESHALDL
ncbi:MAG: threonine--tRNA ligase [Chloroflexi bacterium]|nr:MAG: threonyl-tRNA synthetase [Chloroflexi bacterium OLB13]MBC6955814.1 threonine--tRNA ligase [Chloroflexota bacterium]MBV6437306.1 Threonine--tRNA ligase [Anaerolineae bacterium]MDL1915337.1 threonine--tRNA ligase [Anaerolineae bacterium CFX4]OQY80700.1 MAG: threonine--tRNA ligase [Anaerolineae bacterium UTCFX5]